MKRFNDFADDERPLDGNKIGIGDVVNKEITILAYKINDSKYEREKCTTVQFEIEGQRRVLFTGSTILAKQLEKYEKELPFIATIRRINKYYTLS